jgi:hypothetical protein
VNCTALIDGFHSGRDVNRDDVTTRTSSTTTQEIPTMAPEVALPSSVDESMNLIRALAAPSVREDTRPMPAAPHNQIQFFARSAEMGFGVPYRIERTIFDKDAIRNTYCWQVGTCFPAK